MAILLDSFYNGRRGPMRFWNRRCGHLVSDTSLEELHQFAEGLGLRREWFQSKSIPHYDLTGPEYELAVARGAQVVSSREIVRRAVRHDTSGTEPEAVATGCLLEGHPTQESVVTASGSVPDPPR